MFIRLFLIALTFISCHAYAADLTEKEQRWLSQNPTLVYQADAQLPAVSFDEQGQRSGITPDMIMLMQMGDELPRFETYKFLNDARADVLGGITKIAPYGDYAYSNTYLSLPTVIVANTSLSDLSTNSQILAKHIPRLAVPEDSFYPERMQTLYPEWQVVAVTDHKTAIGMVGHGLIDAALTYDAANMYFAEQLGIDTPKVIQPGKKQMSFVFAVRNDWPELLHLINKSLEALPPEQKQDLIYRWTKQVKVKNFWQQRSADEWYTIFSLTGLGLLVLLVLYLSFVVRNRTARLRALAQHNQDMQSELAALQTTDAVTAIANREKWLDEASKELTRYHRYGNNFAVMLLMLDGFKEVRQEFGQSVADELIRFLVSTLKEQLRDHDVCGRMADNEIAVLLHGVTPDLAESVAQPYYRQS